jgi:small subunit ribosomal protein S9
MAEKITKKPAAKKPAAKPATARKPRATAVKRAPIEPVEAEQPVVAEKVEQAPVSKTVLAKTGHGHSFYAVGKRKTSVAQILLTTGDGTLTLNKLPFESYFQTVDLRHIVLQPLTSMGVEKSINVKGKLHGGGIHSQAEALRHAISRALIQYNPEARPQLKKQGFLTRDPRIKERKKPGLKRARRAPQFSKR